MIQSLQRCCFDGKGSDYPPAGKGSQIKSHPFLGVTLCFGSIEGVAA